MHSLYARLVLAAFLLACVAFSSDDTDSTQQPPKLSCPRLLTAARASFVPFTERHAETWASRFSDPENWRLQLLIAALKLDGHEAKVLRSLGFDLDLRASLNVPTFAAFLERFEKARPHLRPGLLFRKQELYRGLTLGQKADDGWTLVDLDHASRRDVGRLFRLGIFPLSSGRIDHDFWHALAIVAYPDYGAALKELALHFAETSKLSRSDRIRRFSYFYEAFTSIAESDRADALDVLGEPFASGRKETLTLEKILEAEKNLKPEALVRRARLLVESSYRLCRFYGAAGREVGAPFSDVHYADADFLWESVPVLQRRVRHALSDVPFDGLRLDLRTEYTRLRLAIYYSIGMTPEKFLTAAKSELVLPADDPVAQFFSHSGLSKEIGPQRQLGILAETFASPSVSRD